MNLQGQCCSVPLCMYVFTPSCTVCVEVGGTKGKDGVKGSG